MEPVATSDAPVFDLPFSQAVIHGDTVYVSGQVPVDPETGDIVGDDVVAQTERVMENIAAVLDAAGSSLEHVVKSNVYLDDIDDFEGFNEAYETFVSNPLPARSAVEVGDIAIDVLIEIDVVAAVPRPE